MIPGLYPSIPMADYLAMEAVSASLLDTLITKCPAAAYAESWMGQPSEEEAVDEPDAAAKRAEKIGTVAHCIVLEGHASIARVINPAEHPNEKGGGIPRGWTNKAIKAARDDAIAMGLVPMLPDEFDEAMEAAKAARHFIDSLKTTQPDVWRAFQQEGGESESTLIWEDDQGLRCRARPDRISADRATIVDLKFVTGSAEPLSFGRRYLYGQGWYVSAAHYRRGVKRVFNKDAAYYYAVIEQKKPHLCSLVGIEPAGVAAGDERIDQAIAEWNRCVMDQRWDSYPRRAVYPEIPPYLMSAVDYSRPTLPADFPYETPGGILGRENNGGAL
jgi:hypothetical protein